MTRVGIYSGSFDPIHAGHVQFAREAIQKCDLSKVFFLVEPRPRHKQGVKALEHRIRMAELALADYPELGLIVLDQARFSVLETWPQLQARFQDAELAMLMGDDVFARLSHWPRVDNLITSASFIIGQRTQSASELREHLAMIGRTRGLRLDYRLFEPSAAQYSSTNIRQALRQSKVPAGLDPAVLDYIRQTGLYSATNA